MKGMRDMMKPSTKMIVTGAAGVLGVAMAAGVAQAATGSLTSADAPGQVLQVSGVGPAAGHASPTAVAHANANAKGLFGGTTGHTGAKIPSGVAAMPTAAAGHSSVGQVARPMAHTLPSYHAVMPAAQTPMRTAAPQPAHSSAGMMPPTSPMH